MPTYEYKCRQNGHIFEVFQKISDEPLTKCQMCDSPVDKLISATAFHLKGTGWYTTDYKKSSSSSNGGSKAKSEGNPSKESPKEVKTEPSPGGKTQKASDS